MAGVGLLLLVGALVQGTFAYTSTAAPRTTWYTYPGTTRDWRYQTSAAYGATTRDWRYQTSSSTSGGRCGSTYYSYSGTLVSPNYPSIYPNNLNCEYTISPGRNVYLKVTDLSLESCCDHLQIYDEHGNDMNASSVDYLYGSHFRVVFKTDGSQGYRGFRIVWDTDYSSLVGTTDYYNQGTSTNYPYSTHYPYSTSGSSHYCDETTYSASGVIESPNYPFGYYNNLNCVYRIRPSTISLLRIDAIELENSSDRLLITYTDPSGYRHSRSLTGTDHWSPIIGRDFDITFTTDHSVTRKGFQLSWRPDTSPYYGPTTDGYQTNTDYTTGYYARTSPSPNRYTECGGDYMANYVVIESPGYPHNYPNNAHCVYMIDSPVELKLDVEVLDTESGYDYLYITSGTGNNKHTLDGRHNNSYSYTGSHFQVEFDSDSSATSTGFRIVAHPVSGYPSISTTPVPAWMTTQWMTGTTAGSGNNCGGTYRAEEGVIESPNFPNDYPNNLDCWYYIYAGTEATLELKTYNVDSYRDYIYVLNDNNNPINTITTSGYQGRTWYGAHFRVRFTSDYYNQGVTTNSYAKRGFRFVWKAVPSSVSPTSWWGYTTTWWRQSTHGWGGTTDNWRYSTDSSDRIRVECTSTDVNVAVPRDIIRQVFPGVSEYDLTLNNPNCRGQVHYDVVMFSSSILGCGMTREETMYEVIYENRIRPSGRSQQSTTPYYNWGTTNGAAITRFDSADIKVECRFDHMVTDVGYYHPQNNNELVARGRGNFSAYMDFYRDYSYNYKIYSYPVRLNLNEDVYVDLRLDAVDPGLKIALQDCYASPSSNRYPYYNDRYTLIRDGCPVDHTVALEYSPSQHVHFRFRAFEFLKDKDDVYLTCNVRICNDTDYYNRCHRNCNFRRRRDTSETEDHDFHIFQGPLKFRDERSADAHSAEQENKRDSTVSGSVPAIVMAVSAVAMVMASVVMVIMMRRRRQRSEERLI